VSLPLSSMAADLQCAAARSLGQLTPGGHPPQARFRQMALWLCLKEAMLILQRHIWQRELRALAEGAPAQVVDPARQDAPRRRNARLGLARSQTV